MNERSLEPRMLPWQPKFYKDQTFFLYNFLFLEFQWIQFSNYRVIVKLITQWSTCKPDDVIIFTFVVVCSEPILSVMFRPFKRRYLWNQIRYQKMVNSVHSCFHALSYEKIKSFVSYPLWNYHYMRTTIFFDCWLSSGLFSSYIQSLHFMLYRQDNGQIRLVVYVIPTSNKGHLYFLLFFYWYLIGSPSGEPMFSLCRKWRKICRTLQSHVILVWTIRSRTAPCFKPQVAIFQLRSSYKLHQASRDLSKVL